MSLRYKYSIVEKMHGGGGKTCFVFNVEKMTEDIDSIQYVQMLCILARCQAIDVLLLYNLLQKTV